MIGAHLTIIVPGTPVPKGRPRVVLGAKGARAYTPARTKAYEQTIAAYALQARQAMPARWPLDGIYRVEVRAYKAGLGDLDNIIKAALDACNGVLWADDRQVIEIHAYRHGLWGGVERLVMEVAPC